MKVLLAHVQSAPVPPSERSPHPIPKDLEEVVLSLLKKTPEQRPEDAADLRRRLEACAIAGAWTEARAAEWWAAHQRNADPTNADPTADQTSPDQTKGRSQAAQ